MTTSSNDETDVGVVSITDRRRIKALESQVEDLTQKLAAANGRVQPGLANTRSECAHRGAYDVDENRLEVVCRECKAPMDPYDVLRRIAHREVNFCYTLNALRAEKKTLSDDVEKLKAQRSRIRRQVRSADDVPPAGIAKLIREHGLRGFGVGMRAGGIWEAAAVRRDGMQETSTLQDPEAAMAAVIEGLKAHAKEGENG